MIKINFTPEEINALDHERYHHPHPRVQKKMEALYLKSQGVKHKDICRLCQISKTTLALYLKQYQEGGIDRLKELGYKGHPSELREHASSLEEYFKNHPPRTVAEAQAAIENLTGIKRSPTQVRAFMKRLGLSCRKVGQIPAKATTPDKIKEQEEFKEQKLEPRLEEAKEGKRVVFFVDAAHFVHGAFLGFLWCFVRLFLPTPSGRKRFNVLGALNAVTKEIITITNETYINAESVCQLLLKISQMGIRVPITLILDNARYQKCQLVQDYAAALNIELLYLPSYSPNLNLIERFWRFVKGDCLYSKYYEKYPEFKTAIENCINTAHTDHREELESLLTWNFQTFKNVQFLAV
jgi:transposase